MFDKCGRRCGVVGLFDRGVRIELIRNVIASRRELDAFIRDIYFVVF